MTSEYPCNAEKLNFSAATTFGTSPYHQFQSGLSDRGDPPITREDCVARHVPPMNKLH
jgi:hypothetical protein